MPSHAFLEKKSLDPKLAYAPIGERLKSSRLLVLTNLAAVDGTLFAFAASGAFTDFGGAALVGLTVIGGAGAWSAARDEFARPKGVADWLALAALAFLSTFAAVAVALAGAELGTRVALTFIPIAAGIAVLMIAVEIAGLRLPRLRGVGLPAVVLVLGGALEVVASIL